MQRLRYDLDTAGTSADDSAFITISPGWNVWTVWQSENLDFSLMMAGLDRDRRLRIWVEDAIREGAPGAEVADGVALKGSQIEILNAPPAGLKPVGMKEGVPGDVMLVAMPAKLRTVRFFNRGPVAKLTWPHDNNYLVDTVYQPNAGNPLTSGAPPNTLLGGATSSVVDSITSGVKPLMLPIVLIAAAFLLYQGMKNGKR